MLAATVAHELRNPLAAINICVANIKRKTADGPVIQQLDNIKRSTEESEQIISNLLHYSRLKPPKPEKINVSELLKGCVKLVREKSKKKILVQEYLNSPDNLSIEADPVQIKEVFNNILNNAYDAVEEPDGTISLSGCESGEFIRISITDNGAGIDKEDMERIFDPFFTTKATGTGLGLSICKQIVNVHGGTIRVDSEPNKGTTVTMALPKGYGIRLSSLPGFSEEQCP
jgi:signal transduction histidine kinase